MGAFLSMPFCPYEGSASGHGVFSRRVQVYDRTGRGPEQVTCVCTACVEGVARSERAAGRPREPSRLGLFVTVAIGGGSLRYLPAAARYMTGLVGSPEW